MLSLSLLSCGSKAESSVAGASATSIKAPAITASVSASSAAAASDSAWPVVALPPVKVSPAWKQPHCIDPDEKGCTERCSAGDQPSCLRLASMYDKVMPTPQGKHPDRARSVLEDACKKSVGPACRRLSTMLREGRGGPKDEPRAYSLAKSALDLEATQCDQGDPKACDDLALAFAIGEGRPKERGRSKAFETRSRDLETQACEAGDAPSCTSAGILSMSPSLIEKGCTGGDPFGCQVLGNQYAAGEGVPKDPEKAKGLLEKACKAGVLQSCEGGGQ